VKRSRIIVLIVGLLAVLIVWRVGFYNSPAEPVEKGGVTELASETNKLRDVGEPAEANEPKVATGEGSPEKLADVGEPNKTVALEKPGEMRGPVGPFPPMGPPGMRVPPNFAEPNAMASMQVPEEMRRAFDPNRPGGPGRGFGDFRRSSESRRFGEPNRPSDGNEPMEALNLKDVEMKSIIQKIAEWTGKVIIPSSEAMSQKVTIYSAEKLPRSQALAHIYSALRMKGYVAEHGENAIYITPMKDAKLGFVPTIPAGQPLALLENKDQIVQKFFKLENYRPTQMSQVIGPLVGDYGFVSADETTRTLLVIDTVSNLMRIERIIVEFDVPEAEQSETNIFPVEHGDPSEIVQMLKILLGQSQGISASRGRGGSDRDRFGGPFGGPPSFQASSQSSGSSQQTKTDSSKSAGAATSVVVTSTRGPIILIPEPRRKWIIARASAEDMKLIDEWIKKLDRAEPVESEYEVVQLRYADADEVERSIEEGLRDLPGTEFLPSINVEPLRDSGQVVIFGRKDLREMVKKIIAEMDIPPGQFETEHFRLKNADPDQVKTSIEELYTSGALSGMSGRRMSDFGYGYGYGSSRTRQSSSSDTVKVISYVSLRQVTVIASPENMVKIRQQIEEWDRPLDVNEVRPRIIELRNSDPVQMADLLTTLFSEKSTSSRTSFYEMMFGTSGEKQKIVGALYGQLTFEDVPGTKKIIVISKVPEAYAVIEQLIHDLDKQEMGEIPKVITLKYADPEDLAERLNAMFNQPGTSAPIRRSAQGLSSTSTTSSQSSSNQSSSSSGQSSGTGTTGSSSTSYTPPWSGQGARTTTGEEMPISNVIGKVRFVPETHSKSLLVLAPPEFMPNIEALVQELDIPGKQVMVKAVIVEVKHSDVTSLGLQLASDKQAFGDLEENAITAVNALKFLENHGAGLLSGTLNVGNRSEITTTADITALIDFLVKKIHAKILNQQTLWTKDNGEAIFFKGDNVALQTTSTSAGISGQITASYEFNRVGMTLRVRPRITPEKNVDMVLNIILSQLTSELVNKQPKRTEMETTTNMIVKNGETVMLGGILFQQDSKIERKLPLLGDIPLAGGLFRHNEVEQSNNELIVFVTPYVIDEGQQVSPEASQEMAQPMERLKEVQEHLKATAEQLEQPSQQEQD